MSLSIVVATGVPPCRYLAAPQLMRHARYFSVTLSIKKQQNMGVGDAGSARLHCKKPQLKLPLLNKFDSQRDSNPRPCLKSRSDR
jgi:hypothetical protein